MSEEQSTIKPWVASLDDKGNGTFKLREQPPIAEAGEVVPVIEWVEPIPLESELFMSPSERLRRLEDCSIPEIQRLNTVYQNACDSIEVFEQTRESAEHKLASDYVYVGYHHSKVKPHFLPGPYYLNHAIKNNLFSVPPEGQKGTYKLFDLKTSPSTGQITAICIPSNISDLPELLTDSETKKYVSAEMERKLNRLLELRDKALMELTEFKALVKAQYEAIPRLSDWL